MNAIKYLYSAKCSDKEADAEKYINFTLKMIPCNRSYYNQRI